MMMMLAAVAIAGQVYDRAVVTLGASTGTATWTNTQPYASIKLVRIWNEGNLAESNNVAVTRIATIGAVSYTQSVGTVSFSSGGAGSQATLTAAYMKPGDRLAFSSTTATGSTCIVEYEVQEH